MKKRIVSALLIFSALLTGCAGRNEVQIVPENPIPSDSHIKPWGEDNSETGEIVEEEPAAEASDTSYESDATDNSATANEATDSGSSNTSDTPEIKDIDLSENSSGKAEEAVYNLGQAILNANIKKDNIMVSPVSIERALTMAMDGADGTTRDEIFKALYGSLSGDVASELTELYKTFDVGDEESFVIANSIWTNSDNSIVLDPEYEKTVSEKYGALATSLPFSDSSSVDKINSWVAQKTHDQIKSIINELNDGHNMVLVNTTYFKSNWYNEFSPSMDKLSFTNADGSTVKVASMRSYGDDIYIKTKGYEGFKKGYTNGFYYVALLPGKGQAAADVLNNLSYEDVANAASEPAILNLTLPSYESDYEVELSDTLKALGVTEAFTDQAQFDRMCNDSSRISSVVHKTHIKLDEKGTEASAATSVIMATTTSIQEKPIVDLVFDRPFVYYIFNQNDVPVFMGVVNSLK